MRMCVCVWWGGGGGGGERQQEGKGVDMESGGKREVRKEREREERREG